jgi:chromosome segregation ATPase
MAKDEGTGELEEQLAEALAQVDSLQTAAADAEARAATAREDLRAVRAAESEARAQLTDAETARDSGAAELALTRAEAAEARSQVREAALRYREARLAAAPEVPHDLVPELETLEEIDREFEAAQRIVAQLREKMGEEAQRQNRTARVPAGAPARRSADVSGLSASEKIRLGLQQLSDRESH